MFQWRISDRHFADVSHDSANSPVAGMSAVGVTYCDVDTGNADVQLLRSVSGPEAAQSCSGMASGQNPGPSREFSQAVPAAVSSPSGQAPCHEAPPWGVAIQS